MADVEMVPVTSSHIDEVGFDPQTGILLVRFRGGELYQYDGITTDLYTRLLRAGSIGKFHHQFIKPRGGERIE